MEPRCVACEGIKTELARGDLEQTDWGVQLLETHEMMRMRSQCRKGRGSPVSSEVLRDVVEARKCV